MNKIREISLRQERQPSKTEQRGNAILFLRLLLDGVSANVNCGVLLLLLVCSLRLSFSCQLCSTICANVCTSFSQGGPSTGHSARATKSAIGQRIIKCICASQSKPAMTCPAAGRKWTTHQCLVTAICTCVLPRHARLFSNLLPASTSRGRRHRQQQQQQIGKRMGEWSEQKKKKINARSESNRKCLLLRQVFYVF